MILQATVRDIIETNAYFYIDDATRHGFLIDPGAQADELLKIIGEHDWTIEKILLTHGHFDHIGAVPDLQSRLNIQVYMQGNGCDYVTNPEWNLSQYFGSDLTIDGVTYVDDFATITLDANKNFGVQMIPLSGHTTDGAIYYSSRDAVAFVGDSIFFGSYGRTDFPGGDETTLIKNLAARVLTLPDETVLLSGHSEPTTVAEEKTRPWFNRQKNSFDVLTF